MLFALAAAVLTAPTLLVPPAHPVETTTPAHGHSNGAVVLDAAVLDALRSMAHPRFDLPLPDGTSLGLVLEPVDVLADGAQIVVMRPAEQRPGRRTAPGQMQAATLDVDLKAFAVRVEGRTDAIGFVGATDDLLGGFVTIDGRTLWLSSGPVGAGLPPVVWDPTLADPSYVPQGTDFCSVDMIAHPAPPPSDGGIAGQSTNACREVTLAIETDAEFTVNLFGGNEEAAAAYALALTAATSEIYTNDLNVRLRVGYLRLWNVNAATDPWNQTSTVNQLFQFRDTWIATMGSVPRDNAQFLSGRGLGGGVAWLPGLCGDFSYGLSANLGGSFPYPLQNNSNANWDIMVYAHELGHNFGSPHTHSYSPPLDGCGNNDCSQANQGTIMSYCHLCSGGLANVALAFHPENVVTMSNLLDSIGCTYEGGAQPAIATDDYVVAPAGTTAVVDPLFNDERSNCEALTIQSFDAVTAAGVPVVLVPAPPGGRPTFTVAVPSSAAGEDTFTYTIIDGVGSTATATVVLDVLPLLPATNVVGTTPGVEATYYAVGDIVVLPDFSLLTPLRTEVVGQVNFPSTGGVFAGSGLADFVGAVFEGWFDAPSSGFYTFFCESDDGSKLFVGDTLVVSNDGLHGMVEKSGVVGLAKGRHKVRIEFFERGGGAGVIARYSGMGAAKQVIPASLWSTGGTIVGPDLDGNGSVDAADLAILLGAWGSSDPTRDLNADGTVDAADLALLLGSWS
jgi:hypothetical protein